MEFLYFIFSDLVHFLVFVIILDIFFRFIKDLVKKSK